MSGSSYFTAATHQLVLAATTYTTTPRTHTYRHAHACSAHACAQLAQLQAAYDVRPAPTSRYWLRAWLVYVTTIRGPMSGLAALAVAELALLALPEPAAPATPVAQTRLTCRYLCTEPCLHWHQYAVVVDDVDVAPCNTLWRG